MSELSPIGRHLVDGLRYAEREQVKKTQQIADQQKVNIVGAGGILTAAYEQLRNAAENTEEHLVLQSAIKRFYKQLFLTRDEKLIKKSGDELAVELTLAGYLPNDSLVRPQLDSISKLAWQYYQLSERLTQSRAVAPKTITQWTVDVLSSNVEATLNDHSKDRLFADVAYRYFESLAQKGKNKDQSAALLVAIYRTLLKSNNALIRATLLKRYEVSPDNYANYLAFNKNLDELLESREVDKLSRTIDRQGAPLRILRRMIDEKPDINGLLAKREVFLESFEQQVGSEYLRIGKRLNRAIVRSVIFLIITKFLIGIAIEVPYDYWSHGQIIWVPLIINLFFPPLYMIALRTTLSLPSYANTTALVDRIDNMLYGDSSQLIATGKPKNYGGLFSTLYTISALLVFAGATWILWSLNFSPLHIVIFFVFLSAASFLGFRLSRMIRELEVINARQNGLTFLRDIIYLPFVIVGQWISDKYSQINIVSTLLDMLIELPMKSVLRLIRQWSAFIDERKDRI